MTFDGTNPSGSNSILIPTTTGATGPARYFVGQGDYRVGNAMTRGVHKYDPAANRVILAPELCTPRPRSRPDPRLSPV